MSVLRLNRFFSHGDDVVSEIDAFESETAEVLNRTRPRVERAILYVIAATVFVGLIFISFAKIDRVVSASGRIIPVDGTLTMNPLETAIVRSIKVAPGDVVKQGQVLATLDPTFKAADLAQLIDKEHSLAAEVARLQAEQNAQPYVGDASDPYQALQSALFQQRAAQYKSAVNDFDERINSDAADIARLSKDIELALKRLGLASDVEKMRVELEQQEAGSHLNSLVATDTRVGQTQLLSNSQNQLVSTRHQLESLKSQRDVYIQQWRTQTATDLVTKSGELDTTRQDLAKAQKLRDLVDMRAPQDAVVLSIGDYSIGSVVQQIQTQGSALITLVPLDAPLEVEAQIDNQDIGFVQPGDPVQIKLDAYTYNRHGTAKGVIKTISQDAFTETSDHRSVPAFFKARVTITDTALKDVPKNFRLIPGMTVISDVMVGKRTILSYIVEGALKTGSEAMREP